MAENVVIVEILSPRNGHGQRYNYFRFSGCHLEKFGTISHEVLDLHNHENIWLGLEIEILVFGCHHFQVEMYFLVVFD